LPVVTRMVTESGVVRTKLVEHEESANSDLTETSSNLQNGLVSQYCFGMDLLNAKFAKRIG
jgi:hypothetical protein